MEFDGWCRISRKPLFGEYANALIHQDFMATGVGPVVEIYDNRIEVTNPGNGPINTDRILDERRSRNEKLAATMRSFGLCEERDGGLDK